MSSNTTTMTAATINQSLLANFSTSTATRTVHLPSPTAIRTFDLSMPVAFSTSHFTAAMTIATRMLSVSVTMLARFSIASVPELKIEIAFVISSVNMPEIELVNADGIVVRRTTFFQLELSLSKWRVYAK